MAVAVTLVDTAACKQTMHRVPIDLFWNPDFVAAAIAVWRASRPAGRTERLGLSRPFVVHNAPVQEDDTNVLFVWGTWWIRPVLSDEIQCYISRTADPIIVDVAVKFETQLTIPSVWV